MRPLLAIDWERQIKPHSVDIKHAMHDRRTEVVDCNRSWAGTAARPTLSSIFQDVVIARPSVGGTLDPLPDGSV